MEHVTKRGLAVRAEGLREELAEVRLVDEDGARIVLPVVVGSRTILLIVIPVEIILFRLIQILI